MLPVTSQRMAESSAAVTSPGGLGGMMLSALLAVIILAAVAAFLLFLRLERQDAERRQALSGEPSVLPAQYWYRRITCLPA